MKMIDCFIQFAVSNIYSGKAPGSGWVVVPCSKAHQSLVWVIANRRTENIKDEEETKTKKKLMDGY